MNPWMPKKQGATTKGPEAAIQEQLVKELLGERWYVKVMVGNIFQYGVPDLFAAHPHHGQRWIEVKNPASFSFTPAQQIEFPLLSAAGVGIWILFSVADLPKLFKPANWEEVYLRWKFKVTK